MSPELGDGSVFTVFMFFFFFQDAEGFAGRIGAVNIFGVEDAAEFISGKAINFGIIGIRFGAKDGGAISIPFEW